MEPPSTPARTPRQGVVQGQPVSATIAASPFTANDPDSPRMRASTLAYGPRTRVGSSITSPPTPKAPSAPKTTPKTPQMNQSPLYTFPTNSSSNIAGDTPGSANSAASDYAKANTLPRTPIRVPSRGHQRVPSSHRPIPVQQRTPSATHSRTPSSASYNRQRALEHAASGSASHTPGSAPGPVVANPTAAAAAAAAGSPSVNNQQPISTASLGAPVPKKPQKRTSIGPWDFVKSIGAGSMGQVKLAIHHYTKQMAAVKIVPKAFTHKSRDGRETNEAKDARVVREAAIGRLLNHPNVSKLYDVYSMTGHFYLVFEYISGGQMLDYIISHGCVKETQARRFARSISSALDYCHHNSVVHRDLKIENILIADDGDIRLIDFGLSNLFRRDDLLRTFCGSLYFAAPELLNAMPYVGPEIDVWSFGVVLYVLVCGKVPFEDKSMTVLHAKIKRGTVDYPQWLSSLCVDLLSRMLTVNPSERATLSEVMHHPWMIKGYDSPPQNYVPRRLPLTMDSLDPQVIEEMEALGIGDAHNIEKSLKMILGSAEYQAALDNWYDLREVDLASTQNEVSTHSRNGLEMKTPNPLDSFAPEISCYFLTRERLIKSKSISMPSDEALNQAFAPQQPQSPSRQTTPTMKVVDAYLDGPSAKHNNATLQQPLPLTPAPKPIPTVEISSPQPDIINGRARSKTLGSSYSGQSKPPLMLTPADMPKLPGAEEQPPRAYVSNIPQQAQVGLVTPMSAVKNVNLDATYDSMALTASPRNKPSGRVVSQPITQSHHESPSQQPQQQQQQQQQQTLSLFRKFSLRRKNAGHTRAKSTSATSETLESRKEPNDSSSQNLSGMPSIESPKPVFFRGIFSVQSTSTKPLHEIRAEIIRVLTQKQIEFVEVRGGFACVARRQPHPQQQQQHQQQQHPHPHQQQPQHNHQSIHHNYQQGPRLPSSSSSSSSMYGGTHHLAPHNSSNSSGISSGEMNPTPSRSNYGDHLVPPSPQTPPATPRHRRMVSENGILSPAVSIGGSAESIDIEIGASDMLGESQHKSQIPVRFEIDIVRVPIVSLHGIQFKKMTGNVWQYKNLAQEILESLRI